MPQTSAFGGLMEGITGGIAARDRMDLNREYKEHLRQKNTQGAIDLQEGYDARLAQWTAEGGDEEGFLAANPGLSRYTKQQDPALMRFGKWLGQRIGFGQGASEEAGAVEQADFATPEVETPRPQQGGGLGARGIPVPYADGGAVDDDDPRLQGMTGYARALGRRQLAQADQSREALERRRAGEDAGGFGAFMGDLGRSAANYFDDTVAGADTTEADAALQRLSDAEGARATGAAARETLWETGEQMASTVGGLAKDLFWDNPVREGVAGFLGFEGDEATQGIPEQGAATRQMSRGEKTAAGPGAGDAVTQAIDAPARSNEQVAQTAIQEGEVQALENLDYKLLVDQGVSPDELPSMTTTDWSDYRREMLDSLMARGASPSEALQEVEYMTVGTQMRGFQREGQKALLYLQTGQAREAAMALRQAYQYFPNGVGVKFGMANDPKTGQPAIVAMGVSEETGEPTGSPMLITTERLNVMMENMSNPQAFRTWTQDGRDLQVQIAQLESLDQYRQGSMEIARAGAITDRLRAAGDAGGGLSPSEVLARDKYYAEAFRQSDYGELMDEGVVEQLASLASQVERATGRSPNVVIDEIRSAWRGTNGGRGGEAGLIEYLESLRGE